MKKTISLFLILLFFLSGCTFSGERIKEPVNFYYLRNNFDYRSNDGVIACEQREASGHLDNLSYLLALYRLGPSDEDLLLPFPEGTALLMMEATDEEIKLALGSNAANMSNAEFSLACACLTMTCLELTDAQCVTVINGDHSITMTRDTIALTDTIMQTTTEDAK